MKALILGAAFLSLFSSTASAVDVTISLGPKSRTFVVSAPNAARFTAWALAAYPTIPNPAYVTPCGPPLPACLPQTLVNPEPVLSAIDGLWAGLKANVLNFEREKNRAAVADPGPIN